MLCSIRSFLGISEADTLRAWRVADVVAVTICVLSFVAYMVLWNYLFWFEGKTYVEMLPFAAVFAASIVVYEVFKRCLGARRVLFGLVGAALLVAMTVAFPLVTAIAVVALLVRKHFAAQKQALETQREILSKLGN